MTRLLPLFRTTRDLALAAVLLASLAALLGPSVQASEKNSAEVSFLEGKATASSGGKAAPKAIALGSKVFENDIVETQAATKVELKMKDGSVIRVGPASKMQLQAAFFGEKGEKTFSARLFFGRVWSKVTGLVGGESKFEVETDNAVAGVRGTTFRVDAATDKSLLVRVYAGSVAMAPGAALATAQKPKTPGGRVQVAGPREISKKDWEILVGKMMQLAINSDGSAGAPTAFTEDDDANDEWAAWNRMMDDK